MGQQEKPQRFPPSRPQSLNAEVDIKTPVEIRTIIEVGNTGFRVFIDRKDEGLVTHFDFTPEGAFEPVSGKRDQYRTMLHLGLFTLYTWGQESANWSSIGVDQGELSQLTTTSNPTLTGYIQKLFSAHGQGDLVSLDHRDEPLWTFASIDWQAFLSLDRENTLITLLRSSTEEAERTTVAPVKPHYQFSGPKK